MFGYIRVAAATADIALGDPAENRRRIEKMVGEMEAEGVQLALFPELSLTGASLGDLYSQKLLLEEAEGELEKLLAFSKEHSLLFFVGLPLLCQGKRFDAMAAIQAGRLLGLIPRTVFPQRETYDRERVFTACLGRIRSRLSFAGQEDIPLDSQLLMLVQQPEVFSIRLAFVDDRLHPMMPDGQLGSADVILLPAALSAQPAVRKTHRHYWEAASSFGRILVSASAGRGESSTDRLFSGEQFIAEGGEILLENKPEDLSGWIYADIDLERARLLRPDLYDSREAGSLLPSQEEGGAVYLNLDEPMNHWQKIKEPAEIHLLEIHDPARCQLARPLRAHPFIPESDEEAEEILQMQARGLARRLEHLHGKNVYLGISGGLDSCLALLVCLRAFDMLKLNRRGIHCVTMPAFGTSQHTLENARRLAHYFKLDFRVIPLEDVLHQHFKDIDLDPDDRSVTFENAQARERTQILMDLANKDEGLVIGTGDLSEIALGWNTYNGDQMSHYAVNACIPKTLVRALTAYEARRFQQGKYRSGEEKKRLADISDLLLDIVITPISPELLPPDEKQASQQTEKVIGLYDLHDFFLYYAVGYGFSPSKILFLALQAFDGRFGREEILRTMRIFYQRFFNNQFKRSASPDGAGAGLISLSPRGGWRMPSDVGPGPFLQEIDRLLGQ